MVLLALSAPKTCTSTPWRFRTSLPWASATGEQGFCSLDLFSVHIPCVLAHARDDDEYLPAFWLGGWKMCEERRNAPRMSVCLKRGWRSLARVNQAWRRARRAEGRTPRNWLLIGAPWADACASYAGLMQPRWIWRGNSELARPSYRVTRRARVTHRGRGLAAPCPEVREVDEVGAYRGGRIGLDFCVVRPRIFQEAWVSDFA